MLFLGGNGRSAYWNGGPQRRNLVSQAVPYPDEIHVQFRRNAILAIGRRFDADSGLVGESPSNGEVTPYQFYRESLGSIWDG